jgi:hypothetical protein
MVALTSIPSNGQSALIHTFGGRGSPRQFEIINNQLL